MEAIDLQMQYADWIKTVKGFYAWGNLYDIKNFLAWQAFLFINKARFNILSFLLLRELDNQFLGPKHKNLNTINNNSQSSLTFQ